MENRETEFISENRVEICNLPELPYAIEEAINRLRVNISFCGSRVKKIMIVSSVPDEGKSFITMQLWRQMAEAEVRTVLVDADLRKSVMMDKYKIRPYGSTEILGISHYLANEVPLGRYILHTNIGAGDLLPNTENVVNPSMLLEGDRLGKMLDMLAEKYRYVFVDVPPLNLVSDGERIGSLCDGAILVVRGGETPKSMVRNSIRQLERAGCPLLGIVLSRVKGSGSGYYYKRYGKSYYGKDYYGKGYYYGK